MPKKGFVTITNEQIYEKILSIETKVQSFNDSNQQQHEELKGLINCHYTENKIEHEKIKGQANIMSATIGGVVSVLVLVGTMMLQTIFGKWKNVSTRNWIKPRVLL